MADNDKTNWQEREVGALWKNQGRNQTYLTGHVTPPADWKPGDQVKLVIFSNKNKNKTNQPDFRMYLSESKEGGTTSETTSEASTDKDVLAEEELLA